MTDEIEAGRDPQAFAQRYTAVWNELDPQRRRVAVESLWAPDGVEFIESRQWRGHAELYERVSEAVEQFGQTGAMVFRCAGDAVSHHGGVRFTVHMLPRAGGEVVWTGAVFLRLDGDGRIVEDFQFANPPTVDVAAHTAAGTRAVVTEFLRRSADGDPDRIAQLYADEVDWQVSWPSDTHPDVPWLRPRATRADVADHFRTFARYTLAEQAEVDLAEVLVAGDDAVLLGVSTQRLVEVDTRFRMAFALRLTVRDGRIVRHHMYEDSLAVATACAAAPPPGQRPMPTPNRSRV